MVIDTIAHWFKNGLKCPYCKCKLNEYELEEYFRYVCEIDEEGEFEADELKCPKCGKYFKISGELKYEPKYKICKIEKDS